MFGTVFLKKIFHVERGERMSEYIRRQDAINEIEKTYGSIIYQEDGFNRADAIDILNKIPTADIQPVKRGEWIADEDGNIHCSVCGRNGVGEFFCEHCGAKMDIESEG